MGGFDFFYIRLYLDLYTVNGIAYHTCDCTLNLMPRYSVNTTLAIVLCLDRNNDLEDMLDKASEITEGILKLANE